LALPLGSQIWFNHILWQGSIVVKSKISKKKRRPGRPFEGGRDPLVGIRLPKDQIAAIDRLAKGEGIQRSEMIRRLIATGQAAMEKR
jgi:hypothetical protein